MLKNRIFGILRVITLGYASLFLFSCSGPVKEGILIITESAGMGDSNAGSGSPERCRIIMFSPSGRSGTKVLTRDFFAATSPDISYDSRFMLFSGRKNENDPWQVWEMDLHNLRYRKVTSSGVNCTEPAYLPGGRLVFIGSAENDTARTANLYTCNLDGSGQSLITFSPADNSGPIVLKDGRLLVFCRNTSAGNRNPMLMVMRPDGTKADMFYKCTDESTAISGIHETADGKIVFVESDTEGQKPGSIISVKYNRPLHTRSCMSSSTGEFKYALPVKPDQYLVSFRMNNTDRFSIFEYDPVRQVPGNNIFSDPDYNVLEIAEVRRHDQPEKLPSEVDMQVKTGLLFCQNINLFNPQEKSGSVPAPKAGSIEVIGIDTTYGIVRVSEDGSFYLKIIADTPFRIRTLDDKGKTISGPCNWLWMRPNERRGCIGCHEDPELVPENIVSLAIKKPPVIVPVHISDVKEKVVELE